MQIRFKFIIPVVFLIIFFSGIINANSGPRNILLEFATGTWCGQCPCGDVAAEQILASYPSTVIIAYHGPYNLGLDPFSNFNGYGIMDLLGFVGYPTGIIDRGNDPYIYAYDYWYPGAKFEYRYNPNSTVNMSVISKTYNPSTRALTVIVSSTALQNLPDQYKICFVITENNVVAYQSASGICVGGPNYVHKWIARNMANGTTGQNLNIGTWNQNQQITDTLHTALDSSWVDVNCDLAAFVFKDTADLYMAHVSQAITVSVTQPLGINESNQYPEEYHLSQNYPNPFNPTTNIKFTVPKNGNVSLKVYDVLGSLVLVCADGFMKAGTYNADVDASSLSSGVYFYTLKADGFMQTKKMVLIK